MKAEYEMIIKIKLGSEIDTLENLKDPHEMATDISQMICDEAVNAGVVACCDILETRLDVR